MAQGRAHSLLCIAGKSSECCQGCELNAKDAEIAELKDDYLRRHNDAVDRFEEITALKAELARANERIEKLEKDLSIMAGDFNKRTDELIVAEAESPRLREKIKKLEARIKTLRSELIEMKDDFALAVKEILAEDDQDSK